MMVTNNLIIRPIAWGDLTRLCEIYSNPKVMRYIYHGHTRTKEETEKKLHGFIAHWQQHGFGVMALIEKITQAIIGYSVLRYFDDTNPELINQIELGYIIDQPFWGKGYATEAAQGCVALGFKQHNFTCIKATILPENIASQKVASHVGMRYTSNLMVAGLLHQIHEITLDDYKWQCIRC